MVQHMYIKQGDTSHQQKKRQKPHDHLNRHRKNTWQNSTSIHDKNPYQSGYRGNISQHNKKLFMTNPHEYNTQQWKLKAFPLKSGTKQGYHTKKKIQDQYPWWT